MSDPTPPPSRATCILTGELETLSPLHIGSGGTRLIDSVKGKGGKNDGPEVAAIVRDACDAPYLPGTAVKGLLRRMAEARYGVPWADAMFGSIKSEFDGVAGAVTVLGARRIAPVPSATGLPYVKGGERQLGEGVFVSARAKMDGAGGVAADHKLFFQEMVAPGTRFELRLKVESRGRIPDGPLREREGHTHDTERACAPRDARDAVERAVKLLTALLEDLAAPQGWSIGKGQADGFGRVKLRTQGFKRKDQNLGPSGEWSAPAEKPVTLQAGPRQMPAHALAMRCPGPFLVIDASNTTQKGVTEKGAPGINPQAWGERLPMLLGSSLSGALRQRARWVASLLALREKPPRPGHDPDPPDQEIASAREIEGLTPLQRLFGITGFRGRLRIVSLEMDEARTWDVTSVKLDRFTGGPVDNALFTTRAFVDVGFKAEFTLEDRPKTLSAAARALDQALLDALLADVRAKGLTLGHGGNKGFGRFVSQRGKP